MRAGLGLLEALVVAGTLLSIARAVHLVVLMRSIPSLAGRREKGSGPLPSASIVVAARDEAPHLERAARSWLAQDVPCLQVVVADDRSSDATPDVLRRLAAEESRLLALRIDERPEGWLGKCHALATGASRATGDFLLFTDADVRLAPDALQRALAAAESEDADVLVLLPDVECDGLVQRALTLTFFQFFLTTMGGLRANRDDGRCVIGVGAFNLVRRSAYEAAGGHVPLRLQVGDDVALVRLVQHGGGRHRLFSGEGLATVRWQQGVRGTLRGLEKNFFWGARFSLLLLVGFTAAMGLHLAPLLGPVAGGALGWTCFIAWGISNTLPHLLQPPRSLRLGEALLHPLSSVLLVAAGWNSAIRTLARGGIEWRGDVFPLRVLKEAFLPFSWWVGRLPARPARTGSGGEPGGKRAGDDAPTKTRSVPPS